MVTRLLYDVQSYLVGAMPTALGGHGLLNDMPTQSRGHGTHQVRMDAVLGELVTRNPADFQGIANLRIVTEAP